MEVGHLGPNSKIPAWKIIAGLFPRLHSTSPDCSDGGERKRCATNESETSLVQRLHTGRQPHHRVGKRAAENCSSEKATRHHGRCGEVFHLTSCYPKKHVARSTQGPRAWIAATMLVPATAFVFSALPVFCSKRLAKIPASFVTVRWTFSVLIASWRYMSPVLIPSYSWAIR